MYRTFWEYRWSLKITLMVLLNYFLFLIIFSSCLLTRTHTLYVILNNLFFTTNDGKRNKNVVLSRQKSYNRKPQKKITYCHFGAFPIFRKIHFTSHKIFPLITKQIQVLVLWGNICNPPTSFVFCSWTLIATQHGILFNRLCKGTTKLTMFNQVNPI